MIGVYLAIFFVMLLLGSSIPIAMGVSSITWLLCNPNVPSLVIAQKLFAGTDSFALMAIPFFMLAGQLMERTGITERIVNFSKCLVGHIRGGLAHATIVTGMLMAGISGSANADASAIGSLMLPALKRDGYEDGFAVSIVASAGALGPIIPPSIIMIMYANATGFSVGKLFLSGVIPGILLGMGFMVVCYLYAVRNKMEATKFVGWKPLWESFKEAIWALIMPFIIIGGILSGAFTATEAGVIATVYGFIYGFAVKKLNYKVIKESLMGGVVSSASPMLIITVSTLFAYMLARENVTGLVSSFCSAYITSKVGFYMFIIALCLLLGMFIDAGASMLMLIPVLLPVVTSLGLDTMQFAIIFIIALLTAGISPPVGVLFFVVASIDNTPINKVVKPIWQFVAVMMVILVLMIFIPGTGTFLPSLLG